MITPSRTGLTFGQALEAAKEGKLISREGWNGKNMFVFQRPADTIEIGVLPVIKSLPEAVKNWFSFIDQQRDPSEQGLTKVTFTSYLCMKAADDSIVNGWLASQTDMTATDWQIL